MNNMNAAPGTKSDSREKGKKTAIARFTEERDRGGNDGNWLNFINGDVNNMKDALTEDRSLADLVVGNSTIRGYIERLPDGYFAIGGEKFKPEEVYAQGIRGSGLHLVKKNEQN